MLTRIDQRVQFRWDRGSPTDEPIAARDRCSNPPMQGHTYPNRTDWWNYVESLPAPRVVVIQDVDDQPGTGAFLGEVHAHILQALNCAGVVTSGSVRDMPPIEALGLPLFASSIAVSRAYVHIVGFGSPVEIGGLEMLLSLAESVPSATTFNPS